MPIVTREDEERTPRTRRQVEMDRARHQQAEEERLAAGPAAPAPATPAQASTMDLSTLLATIQQTMRSEMETMSRKMEEDKKEREASNETLRNEIQASRDEILNKFTANFEEVGMRIKNLEIDVEKVSTNTTKIEERVDKHEERICKLEARGPAPVTSTGKFDLPHFDGTSSLSAFRQQFETLVEGNGWTDKYALTALTLALRGDALVVLENLPIEGRSLGTLMEALETRYGEKHLEHVYRAQLRERTQKLGENLQQWASEIERLVRRAYVSTPEIVMVAVLQAFVDGIRDAEVRATVRLAHHTSLKSALAHALEVEAVRQDSQTYRFRNMPVLREERRTRFGPMCYGCGERGHIRIDCLKSKKLEFTKSGTQMTEEQSSVYETPTVVTQVSDGNSLIVQANLNNKLCKLTVDTGASRTIIKPELIKRTIPGRKQSLACRLQTATGQPVTVLGETDIEFQIGGKTYKQHALIANITDDCILGLDFLKTQQCIVDVARGVLKFPDQETCLLDSRAGSGYCVKETKFDSHSDTLEEGTLPSQAKSRSSVILEDSGHRVSSTKDVAKVNVSDPHTTVKNNCVIEKCDKVSYVRHVNNTTAETNVNNEVIEEFSESSRDNVLKSAENFGREIIPVNAVTDTPTDTPKPVTDNVSDLQKRLEEIHTIVCENSLKTGEKMKTRYDRGAKGNGFDEGTLVWLHNPLRKKGKSPKLQARWQGPYKIITKINDITYRIKQGSRGKPKIVHVDRLARYYGCNNARDEHN